MKYIIKLFPEIIIKSKSVRHLMTKVLQSNIRNVLKRHNIIVKVHIEWDKIVLSTVDNECPENLTSQELISLLQNICWNCVLFG